jgi:thiamine transport system substrate-binding protein
MIRYFVLAFATVLGLAAQTAYAEDKPEFTIYTYDAFASDWGPGGALKAGFEETCACTVTFVAADSSIGALRRAQLEGDSTAADIILGLDTATVGEARKTGLFTTHNVDLAGLSVPTNWTSQDFVPFDYGYLAFVYNTEKVATPPKSFEELADSNFKIVVQDPRSATPGLSLVLWIKALYGDKASEIWSRLADNIITVTPDWSASYALFLKDEADMVLSYTTSPAYHAVAEDDHRFAAAEFDSGHYMQIEVAGILKSSKKQELASAFLAYLVSPAAQAALPHTNWVYPVVPLADGIPAGFENLIQPDPALILPEETILANSRDWIEEMLSALR